MKILNCALILLFTLGVLSCGSSGSDSDSTPPVIDFIGLSSTEASPTIISGDSFLIKIELSDDEDLKSVSFDTATGTELKSVPTFLQDLNTALEAKASSSLTGKKVVIEIPLDGLSKVVASKYKIICNVTDASENPAEKAAYFEIRK